jgi:hypothetical protein
MNTNSLLAGRESPCRDNTIEGNVGLDESPFAALLERDNGEAEAEGQRPRAAFPKGFEAFLSSLLLDLWPDMNPAARISSSASH